MIQRGGYLVVEEGRVWWGKWVCGEAVGLGEVVFNTAMSGYQEVLTDPSYAGQIVVMTSPHIGNVGVNGDDYESFKPHLAGFVVRSLDKPSSWRAEEPLSQFLSRFNVPTLSEVDTRSLTRFLRDRGVLKGGIFPEDVPVERALDQVRSSPPMAGRECVSLVSPSQAYGWKAANIPLGRAFLGGSGEEGGANTSTGEELTSFEKVYRVAVIDCGVKWNILRRLREVGCEVWCFPPEASLSEIEDWSPDGVLISNGPGDPAVLSGVIRLIEKLLGKFPLFGICLGHQLLALAVGGRTYKMKFGHRGINHPVGLERSGRVWVTVHNHGFAVDENSLPREVRITLRSLNDGTVEGLELPDYKAFSVQFHPEASPGPRESGEWFWSFRRLMENCQRERGNRCQ